MVVIFPVYPKYPVVYNPLMVYLYTQQTAIWGPFFIEDFEAGLRGILLISLSSASTWWAPPPIPSLHLGVSQTTKKRKVSSDQLGTWVDGFI